MGLLLSVLVACVGVLEVIACYTHFRLGIVYNQCKSDVTDVARNYAWELRRNHLHHLFPDGQPELEYAKTVRAYREKTQSIAGSVSIDSRNIITTPSTSSYLRVEREDENPPSYSHRNRTPSQDDTSYDQISEIDVDISEHIETYDRLCHVEDDSKTKNDTNETTDNLVKAIEIKSEVNETIKPVQSYAINNQVITDNAAVKISDNVEAYQVCTKQSTAANDSQNEVQITNILQQDVHLKTYECTEIKKDITTSASLSDQQNVDGTPTTALKQKSTNDYVISQQIEDSAPVTHIQEVPHASKDVQTDSKPNAEVPNDASKPVAEKTEISEAKHEVVAELKDLKTSDGVSKEKVEQISEKAIVGETQVSTETRRKTNESAVEKVELISEKAESITEIKVIGEAKESTTNENANTQVGQVSEKDNTINEIKVVDEPLKNLNETKESKISAPAKQIEGVPEKAETISTTQVLGEPKESKTKESVPTNQIGEAPEKVETIKTTYEAPHEREVPKTNESAPAKQTKTVSEQSETLRTTYEVFGEPKEAKTKESAPTNRVEELPEKAETITEIKHEVVETEASKTKKSALNTTGGTAHESEILKQSKTTEERAEKVSEPTKISEEEKLAENGTSNASKIIEETKVTKTVIIESKTAPGLLNSTNETPLEATSSKDDVKVAESPELTVSAPEKSVNETVSIGANDIDTTIQTKVVPLLNSKPELIERIIETGRPLSPLPENKISETTTPTVIPDSLKAAPEVLPPEVPSPETGDSKKVSETDLECEQFLTNTSSLQAEDPLAVPRVPSPYPMSLFGITTDNGISDLMVNEDLLRSLDGIKRSDDRRRSFKKKRSSSSSSRTSRDRSLDAEPKSDTESQPEKREKPTPLVSVEEKNTGEEDVNQEGATSETSKNVVDSSSTQKSASENRKSFQKAAVSSFEEATPSQNDEMNRREMKKTNDNEKQQGSFPQTDAFWVNE